MQAIYSSQTVYQYDTQNNKKNKALIAGIPVDNLDYKDSIDRIDQLIRKGRDNKYSHYIATVNVDFLTKAIATIRPNPIQEDLLHSLRHADLVTADGAPILWLSKLAGVPLKMRVTGADLLPEMARLCAEKNYRMFFLGGDSSGNTRAIQKLQKDNPTLSVAGSISPMITIDGKGLENAYQEDERIVKIINNSGADVLALAFGNPKQEIWFQRNRHKLKVPVSIGIGGTLNFISGSIQRAPKWMHTCGLEWLYRLYQEPARLWKRYALGLVKIGLLVPPIIINRILQVRLKHESQEKLSITNYYDNYSEELQRIFLQGNITNNTINEVRLNLQRIYSKKNIQVVFDFAKARRIENDALANLTRLWSELNYRNVGFTICSVNWRVRAALRLNHITSSIKDRLYSHFSEILTARKAHHGSAPCWFSETTIHLVGNLDSTWTGYDFLRIHCTEHYTKPHLLDLSAVEKMNNAAACYVLQVCLNKGYRICNDFNKHLT